MGRLTRQASSPPPVQSLQLHCSLALLQADGLRQVWPLEAP